MRPSEIERSLRSQGGGWLTPVVALMNRLTYREKFLLISVLFAAPLALVMNLLISELGDRGEFTRKEAMGTRYLRPLMTLFQHAGEARLLARDHAEAVSGADAALAAKVEQMDADFAALSAVDRELGEMLKSSERLAALRKNWVGLKTEVTRPLAVDSDRRFVDFIDDIRALVSLVGDNLILDPGLDTYYLMNLILLKLPEGQGLLMEAGFRGSTVAARQPSTAVDREQLIVLSGRISANIETTRRGMELAFSRDATGTLASALAEPYGRLGSMLSDYQVSFSRDVAYAPFIVLRPDAIVAATEHPLKASFDAWNRTAVQLERLIEARIQRLEHRRRIAWTSALVTLVVVAYLWLGFYAAVVRTVGRLEYAALRMLEGDDPGQTIEIQTRDELGRVVESFNAIATRMRHEWEQAHEEKARALEAEAGLKLSQEELLRAIVAAESANAAKSRFLASMSHELRTPLNSVIGFAQVLLRGKGKHLRPDDVTYLERILANGQHLLGLINSVLDLSKVEADQMEVHLSSVAVDALVRDTVAQIEGRAVDRDVQLIVEVPPMLEPVETDQEKLKQILINLVGNALKFTERGSVTVRVVADPGSGRPAHIDVIDTGVGIPKAMHGKIFEAFQQVDQGTARQYEGTGLGLSISRALCTLLGYRIDVDSEVGRGSTFRIVMGGTPASARRESSWRPQSLRAPAAAAPAPRSNPPSEIVVRVKPALLDLIPGFLQNRLDQIGALGSALEVGDFDAIRGMAHDLKGIGSAYGFDPISDIGRAMEEAARAQSRDEVRKQVALLADYLRRVVVAPT